MTLSKCYLAKLFYFVQLSARVEEQLGNGESITIFNKI